MSVDITVTTVIERPIGEVAAYVGDPSNAPEWYRRISAADWQTDPPVALGSRVTFRARFMGKDLVYTYEVVELSQGEQLTMSTAEGPFPMNTVYTWRPVGDRVTHMTLRNHGEPSGFGRVMAPVMSIAMKRAMTQDLAQLKQLLEAG